MNKVLTLAFVFTLLFSSLALADQCDDSCIDEGYADGLCIATTEDGFCAGDDTYTKIGIEECTDFEYCCCTDKTLEEETEEEETGETEDEESEESGDGEESDTEEDPVEEEETVSLAESLSVTCQKPTSELLFWFLLIIVIILAVANYYKPNKKVEILEEEEDS
jgi:hypothetical protein